jgi:hypothetical protein
MISAFKQVTETAQPAWRSTLIQKIKGEDGLDETLVPMDIGNPESRHLRDIDKNWGAMHFF